MTLFEESPASVSASRFVPESLRTEPAPSLPPFQFLRPVLVRYVQPFKPLIGVFDRRLDRRLVPQNVLGAEARGVGVGPVFVFAVAFYI